MQSKTLTVAKRHQINLKDSHHYPRTVAHRQMYLLCIIFIDFHLIAFSFSLPRGRRSLPTFFFLSCRFDKKLKFLLICLSRLENDWWFPFAEFCRENVVKAKQFPRGWWWRGTTLLCIHIDLRDIHQIFPLLSNVVTMKLLSLPTLTLETLNSPRPFPSRYFSLVFAWNESSRERDEVWFN